MASASYAIGVRLLALDIGERRIGLAVSDVSGTLARPLHTLVRRGSVDEAVNAVVDTIHQLQADDDGLDRVVVGMPTRLDGTSNEQTARVRAFVERLRARTALPLSYQDERLTSREAERKLALRESDWRKRKLRLDAAAAAVILQDYLDEAGERP